MHASMAYVNGAGIHDAEDLPILNALLSIGHGQPKEERQAEEERQVDPIATPGGFENDPPDASNPNEVRERHLRKIKRDADPS
jgi:hypothetical protein